MNGESVNSSPAYGEGADAARVPAAKSFEIVCRVRITGSTFSVGALKPKGMNPLEWYGARCAIAAHLNALNQMRLDLQKQTRKPSPDGQAPATPDGAPIK